MTFKDHFSGHAQAYADARPSYPGELFDYMYAQCPEHELVWDCATGNGQAALSLAKKFRKVIATDGSAEQVGQGQAAQNIEYRQMTAEQSLLEEGTFDLVTVAQALHWFDTQAFFENARACLKPTGILAAWCYAVQSINPEIDSVIEKLYEGILGDYWPPERRLVENHYRDIHFPFDSCIEREFVMSREWNLQQLCGYFTSWSALQRYKRKKGSDPLQLIIAELQDTWGADPEQTHTVSWPLTLKLAKM